MKKIAFTVIAPDRPGIVAELSAIISAQGGNWLESHMANLAGQFAGIVQVEVRDENFASLRQTLESDSASDVMIVIADAGSGTEKPSRIVGFEIVGKDHPGIIREITECVVQCGGSIDEMETELFNASMSGEEMFKAQLHVKLPETCSVDEIQSALENVSQDLMMDLLLEN